MDPLAPLTGFGDDTNTSIKFGILANEDDTPLWNLSPRGSKHPILHSNRTIIQSSGLGEWSVTFRVSLDRTEYLEILQSIQYQRATLRYHYQTTNNPGGDVEMIQGVRYVILPNTLLESVGGARREPDGSCDADLTFTRTAEESAYYGFALYGED